MVEIMKFNYYNSIFQLLLFIIAGLMLVTICGGCGADDYGEGTLNMPGGAKYIGEYKNDKPHGQGKIIYPDGTEERGVWEDGKPVTVVLFQ